MKHILLSALICLLAGCKSVSIEPVPSGLQTCESPRSPFCTREYRPVCGYRESDSGIQVKTYGNACTACADPAVTGYVKGQCLD